MEPGRPIYLLGIFEAEAREAACKTCGAVSPLLAFFAGRGPVERDLTAALTRAILAKGSWWIRRSRLQRAIETAIDDVLMDAKHEAVAKHIK